MKIKVGEKIYDGENEPIMVILSDSDKENIANMLPTATKYCSFPDDYDGDIRKFMNTKFWGEVVEEQFVNYVVSKDSDERHKIYKDYLHEPFTKMVALEAKKYYERIKFYSSDIKDNLENDALSTLIQQIDKFNPTKVSKRGSKAMAYSYCLTIVRCHMHDRIKKEWNKHKTFEPFEEKDQ